MDFVASDVVPHAIRFTVLTQFLSFLANSTVSVPSSCTITSSATATAQGDLDDYSSCSTLVGNLTISGSSLSNAALANVEAIHGSLTITNATSLDSFHADSLTSVTNLRLNQLTVLSSASFGSLQRVELIEFIALPALQTFTTNLRSANMIYISDTSLESVNAFSSLEEVAIFNFNNNRYLTNLQSTLRTVSNALEFSSNGEGANVTFDSLIWANNVTLRDVNSASFAALRNVNASFGLINNSITSLNMSHLAAVGGSFAVVSNDQLTDLHCSNLSQVGGGFVVANNTELNQINGFHNLSSVGGALEVQGNFTQLDLANLRSVRGGANVDTRSGNFSCNPLRSLQRNGGIQGDSFVCRNGATSTSIQLSSTSSSDSSSTDSADASSTDDGSSSSATATVSSSSSSKHNGAAQFAPAGSFFAVVAAAAAALL